MFPEFALPLAPKDMFLRVGNDIGWLGFPAVEATRVCFFGGRVSAWNPNAKAYLVDGVAINGVSGGPAFHLANPQPTIMGGRFRLHAESCYGRSPPWPLRRSRRHAVSRVGADI